MHTPLDGTSRIRFVQQKMSLFFRICSKLACTKTKQITDKASKHNGNIVLSWALVFLIPALTGVVSTLYFILNNFCITLPQNCANFHFCLRHRNQ